MFTSDTSVNIKTSLVKEHIFTCNVLYENFTLQFVLDCYRFGHT